MTTTTPQAWIVLPEGATSRTLRQRPLVPRPRRADTTTIDLTAVEAQEPARRPYAAPDAVQALVSRRDDLADGSDPLAWQDDALCAQTDPEAFFPEKGGSTRDAKRVCMACPVRVPCLDYALKNDERFGIWGGLSERDRRRLQRAAGGAS